MTVLKTDAYDDDDDGFGGYESGVCGNGDSDSCADVSDGKNINNAKNSYWVANKVYISVLRISHETGAL